MANSDKKNSTLGVSYTSADVARLRNGAQMPSVVSVSSGSVTRTLSMKETNRLFLKEHDSQALKVSILVLLTLVIGYLSLGVMGASGQYYPYSGAYTNYDPLQVGQALYWHAYNAIGQATGWWAAQTNTWLLENVPGYWAISHRAGVLGITLICAVILSVSGMLYQNAFKNPMAGPGMLGVGSGVSLGMMILVALYGSAATAMVSMRYALCYGFGALILIFVMLAGKKLSGRDKPFDVVTMLLVGSISSQFLGFITMYVTLFVMDESDYLTFYTISQMLTVDTSLISWIALGTACAVSFIPVIFLRYKFNVLAFEPEEARLLGMNYAQLRIVALLCGAIMILAAQCHVGMVSLVSLIVPTLSRSLFGCEFSKQFVGNIALGMPILLLCRTVTDLIPFVGEGLAIGSIASVVMMPLFIVVMAKNMRGWE